MASSSVGWVSGYSARRPGRRLHPLLLSSRAQGTPRLGSWRSPARRRESKRERGSLERFPGDPPLFKRGFLVHVLGQPRVGQEPAGLFLPPPLGLEQGVPLAQEPPVVLPVQEEVPGGEEGEQGLRVAAPLLEEALLVQGYEPADVQEALKALHVPEDLPGLEGLAEDPGGLLVS